VARIFDNLDILKHVLIKKPFGLISDLDGTLNEIPHNFLETAHPPPTLPQLAKLVNRFELLSIVSGRKTESMKNIININGLR
jgi:trehalose-6-phosphatase